MAPFYSKAYLSTQVNTADRMDLVIALYEGAIGFVSQAMEAVEAGDAEQRGEMISRVSNIIIALSEALDYSQEGGVSGNLFAIYNFQLQQLLEANRTNDIESLQTVKSTLSILLDGWKQVAESSEAKQIREADQLAKRSVGRRDGTSGRSGKRALAMTA